MTQTQIKILEKARHQLKMSIPRLSFELGVSRQWYYDRLAKQQNVLELEDLSRMAMDRVGTPLGEMAVECIRLIDERFIPCPCQTEHGDNGPCPRGHVLHGGLVPDATHELEAV